MIVVKLGGSVLTNKDERETVNSRALNQVADVIADGPSDLVLVHGGGSFGHPVADEHSVSTTSGTRNAQQIRSIHAAMKRLNSIVIDALADRGIAALPVHPLSRIFRGHDGSLRVTDGGLQAMVGEGFIPVTHGDIIVHRGMGATIVSGDELVVALAQRLDADRVGMCTSVPGVLDANEEVIPLIESTDDVGDLLQDTEAPDVTGGMAGKVRALLDLDAPGWIFGLDDLGGFLAGDSPGTRVG